jgi:hypothetical protein
VIDCDYIQFLIERNRPRHYYRLEHGGHRVSRAEFERNIEAKLRDPQFGGDIGPLLATGFEWDSASAAATVSSQLIERLPGEPWRGEG